MFAYSSMQEIPSLRDEEFNLFHSIDRELYTKLVVDLGRDPAESMKVMAFLMWLEQQSTGGLTAVKKMLSLPSWLINQLANESAMCLHYAESSSSSSSWDDINLFFELKYLPELLGRNISLKFFYDHRALVLEGVTRLCTQVCARAFKDIINHHHHHHHPSSSWINQDYMKRKMGMGLGMGKDHHGLLKAASMFNYHQHAMPSKPSMVNDQHDLSRLLSNLNLGEKEENQVHPEDPEDRTIFLTFSKGYPLSEAEVRDFFTRLYGDIIEEIQMQKVAAGAQPLYARLVTRNASVINTVVRGGKAKYNINGKHVCVRKFIKRASSSSSASAPTHSTPFRDPLFLFTNSRGILE